MIDGSVAYRRSAHDATARLFSGHQAGRATIRLSDPDRFLRIIAVLCWPIKFFPMVLVPAVLLAGLTMFKHWNDVRDNIQVLFGELSFVIHLLLGLFIVNLVARLSMGAAISAFGGAVREFGFFFFLGIIPRFYVDRSAIPLLDRNGQLWAYGAPLMVRLGFFAFGILVWAIYRSSGTSLATLALLISQVGLWAFLYAIVPVLPGDGYFWLATYLHQPLLRQKAFVALNAKLRGRPLPRAIRHGEVPVLIVFAVSVILALVVLAFAILTAAALLLTEKLQGVGAVIFLVLFVSVAIWFIGLRATLADRKRNPKDVHLLLALMTTQAAARSKSMPTPGRATKQLIIWACVGAALVIIAFLPSSYNPAGQFEVLPTHRTRAIARTDGEVVDVMVHEGDWVSAGQVLGHLPSSDQQRDIALTRAALDHAEARSARLDVKKSNLDQAAVEPARTIDVARAQREAVSEVKRLRQQLDRDEAELERTTIRAPAAGTVTTPKPQFLTGTWLNVGDEFLQIDDTRVVEVEIGIPQGDIALVKAGAQVRLRQWSEGKREIVGEVTEIAPTALDKGEDGSLPTATTEREQARAASDNGVDQEPSLRLAPRGEPARTATHSTDNDGLVRVKASVPSAGRLLRPGMTGYAKIITGADVTVGEAYLRLCRRFLTVELWSWVP
jgi:multidrug efflux pump subunit AcrA (membrane-fusion protein)